MSTFTAPGTPRVLIRIVDVRTGAGRRRLPADHPAPYDRVAAGPVRPPDGRWMAFVTESVLWLLPVTADGTPTGPARRLTDGPAGRPSWAGGSRALPCSPTADGARPHGRARPGPVRISAPSSVMAIVCSLWAVLQPVALRRVHPSASVTSRAVSAMTHGSRASSSPGRSG